VSTWEAQGVTFELLKSMLRREDELRVCAEVQQALRDRGEFAYPEIMDELQAQVSREFGLNEQHGTNLMRCAESMAQSAEELEEIKALSLYRRFNRCVDGNLHVGMRAPTLPSKLHLLDADFTPVELFTHAGCTLVEPTPTSVFDTGDDASRTGAGARDSITTTMMQAGVASCPRPLVLMASSYS
jgi:hypothetical protein